MFRIHSLYLPICFLALAGGCHRAESVPKVELDRGRDAVQTALEVWKKGGKPETLQTLASPMKMTDESWNAGWQLTSYEITGTFGADDPLPRCAVTLTFPSDQGQPIHQEVVYEIVSDPELRIARDPFR